MLLVVFLDKDHKKQSLDADASRRMPDLSVLGGPGEEPRAAAADGPPDGVEEPGVPVVAQGALPDGAAAPGAPAVARGARAAERDVQAAQQDALVVERAGLPEPDALVVAQGGPPVA